MMKFIFIAALLLVIPAAPHLQEARLSPSGAAQPCQSSSARGTAAQANGDLLDLKTTATSFRKACESAATKSNAAPATAPPTEIGRAHV